MHLVKDIVIHLMVGKEDSIKVRKQEECKRFPSALLKDKQDTLPTAPFTLSRDEITLADERAKSMCAMKSRDRKQVATNGIVKFCLRNMLAHNQRQTLFELLDVIADLCAEKLDSKHITDLESRVHKALVLIEKDIVNASNCFTSSPSSNVFTSFWTCLWIVDVFV